MYPQTVSQNENKQKTSLSNLLKTIKYILARFVLFFSLNKQKYSVRGYKYVRDCRSN